MLSIKSMVLRKCAASYCCRERERVVVYIEAGGLIMGGMEECALGGREKGRKGRAHGSTNHWGRPIRGWMTSVLPASKSCATRQPTCRRSMNVWIEHSHTNTWKKKVHSETEIVKHWSCQLKWPLVLTAAASKRWVITCLDLEWLTRIITTEG